MSFIEKNKLRNSVRNFNSEKELTEQQINNILEAVKNAPTSNNFFVSSAIVVKDKDLLEKISLTLKQKQIYTSGFFIVFLADFNRLDYILNNEKIHYEPTINDLLIATGDAFIQATSAQDAAIEEGLGTCFIGGVREYISELKDLLNIEGNAFPVIGLVIGNMVEQPVSSKPKLNRIYLNNYKKDVLANEIKEYDATLNEYWKVRNIDGDYSKYSTNYLKNSNEKSKLVENIILKNFNLKK
ncbi:nitroreductase family protein [Mycoplasmopsis columbina]|uniref:nitroreductase family protein n=1 Tax=Mycoplasmopsis columbina TaxID=114881 RepID=UPI0004A723A0|nr:nitroreductase family protein [Mycoplasmopsis columbina]VEU76720.1 putative NADPH-dependent oxidoreductase [Mycoplasmopsis columbina]